MALPICAEAFLRSFFVVIKLAVDNWFYTIGTIIICYALRRSPLMMTGFATFIDLVQDLFIGMSIFSGGLLAIVGKIFIGSALALVLGIIWVIMLLTSKANFVLKLFALPIIMVGGVIAGFVPFASLPMSGILVFLFKDRTRANMTCILAIASIVLLSLISFGFVCNAFNWVVTLLQ